MKRITIVSLPLLAVLFPSLGCSSSNTDALMEAARTEFHRRWAAKQFHEIYVNSIDAETHPERAAAYETNWALGWRNSGTFVRDTRELGTHGFEGQFSGRNATQIERWYNTEYTNTKLPIVEFFRWIVTDGTIHLEGFNVRVNQEVRCSFRWHPWIQLFGDNVCETTQLGPAPAVRPF